MYLHRTTPIHPPPPPLHHQPPSHNTHQAPTLYAYPSQQSHVPPVSFNSTSYAQPYINGYVPPSGPQYQRPSASVVPGYGSASAYPSTVDPRYRSYQHLQQQQQQSWIPYQQQHQPQYPTRSSSYPIQSHASVLPKGNLTPYPYPVPPSLQARHSTAPSIPPLPVLSLSRNPSTYAPAPPALSRNTSTMTPRIPPPILTPIEPTAPRLLPQSEVFHLRRNSISQGNLSRSPSSSSAAHAQSRVLRKPKPHGPLQVQIIPPANYVEQTNRTPPPRPPTPIAMVPAVESSEASGYVQTDEERRNTFLNSYTERRHMARKRPEHARLRKIPDMPENEYFEMLYELLPPRDRPKYPYVEWDLRLSPETALLHREPGRARKLDLNAKIVNPGVQHIWVNSQLKFLQPLMYNFGNVTIKKNDEEGAVTVGDVFRAIYKYFQKVITKEDAQRYLDKETTELVKAAGQRRRQQIPKEERGNVTTLIRQDLLQGHFKFSGFVIEPDFHGSPTLWLLVDQVADR